MRLRKSRKQFPSNRRRLVLAGSAAALLWVLLFDSHSIVDRIRWSMEIDDIQERNGQLLTEIDQLEKKILHSADPLIVEQVARESYAMRRDGETVYRTEPANN